jgi:hypothetical protein
VALPSCDVALTVLVACFGVVTIRAARLRAVEMRDSGDVHEEVLD